MIKAVCVIIIDFAVVNILEYLFKIKITDNKKKVIYRCLALVIVVSLSGWYLYVDSNTTQIKAIQKTTKVDNIEQQKKTDEYNPFKTTNIRTFQIYKKATLKLTPYQMKHLKLADMGLNIIFIKVLYDPNLPKKRLLLELKDKIERKEISKVIFQFILKKVLNGYLELDFKRTSIKKIYTLIRESGSKIKIRANTVNMVIKYTNGDKEDRKIF